MVELAPCSCFYEAEGYHQDYLEHNPGGYCHIAPSTVEMLARGVTDPGRWPRPQEEVLADALSPLAFEVTQYAATEHPFTGDYWNATAPGLYVDVATGEPLFSSADKYVSSCGWPAFTRALDPAAVVTLLDTSHGMVRDEVRSRAGNSHLGHVFTGDPESPNGVRFCINSAALAFVPLERMEAAGYGEYVPFVTGAAEKSRG
jgi:peptide methionine sulfoxide reductase msrA/msrB